MPVFCFLPTWLVVFIILFDLGRMHCVPFALYPQLYHHVEMYSYNRPRPRYFSSHLVLVFSILVQNHIAWFVFYVVGGSVVSSYYFLLLSGYMLLG